MSSLGGGEEVEAGGGLIDKLLGRVNRCGWMREGGGDG